MDLVQAPGEPPLLIRARAAARDLWTQWRLLYDLAPTDPRALDVTEEGVVLDLLTRWLVAEANRPPEERDVERLARDKRAQADLVARSRAFLAQPGTREALRRLLPGDKTVEQPKRLKLRSRRSGARPRVRG